MFFYDISDYYYYIISLHYAIMCSVCVGVHAYRGGGEGGVCACVCVFWMSTVSAHILLQTFVVYFMQYKTACVLISLC